MLAGGEGHRFSSSHAPWQQNGTVVRDLGPNSLEAAPRVGFAGKFRRVPNRAGPA